ncbi:MAG: hypothetical protein HY064_03290 [Bacteroidetes bacterium]|nr:hypothetical protein [Bacteroidota bacterium]
MKKNALLILCFIVLSEDRLPAQWSPAVDSLKKQVSTFTYAGQFDSANSLVLKFIGRKDLSPVEEFYGHFLFGDVIKSSGKPDNAVAPLLQCRSYLGNIIDSALFSSLVYGDVAECYFTMLDYGNAKKYSEMSIAESPVKSLRDGGHAVNYMILGYSDYLEKKYPSSLDYYNKAIGQYLLKGESCELPLCYTKMARVYSTMGNDKLAEEYISRAIRLSDSCGIDNYKLLAKRTLFEIYHEKGNDKKALELLLEVNDLVAKIESKQDDQKMTEMEVQYKAQLDDHENKNLEEINRKNEQLLAQGQVELVVALITFIFMLALVFVLIRLAKQRKRAKEKLSLLNEALEQKVNDRTEHLLEANRNVELKSELLSFQNNQLTDFCNILSHNLRSPLGNMKQLLNLVENADNEKEQKLILSKMRPVVNNLNETLSELLESLQVRQDTSIELDEVDIAQCIKNTLEAVSEEVIRLKAVINVNVQDAPAIRYPKKYIESIIHNLLTNALKYSSPERKPVITIATKKKGEIIILSVADNGLGIDLKKYRKDIFRIRKVFHEHPDAKGFGLFITKTQVEALGNKISVESEPGVGSTFFVEFANQE